MKFFRWFIKIQRICSFSMSKNGTDTENWSYYNFQISDNGKYHCNRWDDQISPRAILFLFKKRVLPKNPFWLTHWNWCSHRKLHSVEESDFVTQWQIPTQNDLFKAKFRSEKIIFFIPHFVKHPVHQFSKIKHFLRSYNELPFNQAHMK